MKHIMTSSNGFFSDLLALCAGNSSATGDFPPQRASYADFDVPLMWVRKSCATNNRISGDLSLHGVHLGSSKCLHLTMHIWVEYHLVNVQYCDQ